SQTRPMPAVVITDLSGKTLILIGPNTGLGFEVAKCFAGMNPVWLVLTARDEAKGKQAQVHISKPTLDTPRELWIIDLTNFNSIVTFADRTEQKLNRLDILVESASMMISKYEQVEGWEKT
ncbi:hypothetical protein EV421DRAFT_1668010, partial [Armillaria borealis]